jgi:hypothetical protein
MSLKQNFCSSPWFHMSINNAGQFEYCRWAGQVERKNRNSQTTIHNILPEEFFHSSMTEVRREFLQGNTLPGCGLCHQMESHGKISGRQRQLLKTGIVVDQFEKTMISSPWYDEFAKGGNTALMPQDWQIDLGNYCDGACIFCSPDYSSRLAAEFKKIGIKHHPPKANWTDNPELIQKFVNTLVASPKLAYLHFLGGETIITPAFKIILAALIEHGIHQRVTIGFTTNLSSWPTDIIELLEKFPKVNLGMSIESFHPVNEYVRYPAQQATVLNHLKKWTALAKTLNWFVQIRTTPTALSISHLTTVYDFAWDNKISVESCDFIREPEFLRPSVLPPEHRKPIIENFKQWIASHKPVQQTTIINGRDPEQAKNFVVQELQSYVNYLESDTDQSWRLPDLVEFLKTLESNRKNCVLDYLPEYEQIFRSAGY